MIMWVMAARLCLFIPQGVRICLSDLVYIMSACIGVRAFGAASCVFCVLLSFTAGSSHIFGVRRAVTLPKHESRQNEVRMFLYLNVH